MQTSASSRVGARCAALAAVGLLALAPACSGWQKWRGGQPIGAARLAREISPELYREAAPEDVPPIPQPARLRPCCAFGSDLRVRVGDVPVPGVEIANVVDPEDLGPHNYDNGAVAFEQSSLGGSLVTTESNGLVYTCRGGFIDTAHVRDWADWTLYLRSQVARSLETGLALELEGEGGILRIETRPVSPSRLARWGRLYLSVDLAQWIAFQLSLWHEIATWYGWSTSDVFSEQASAFSPEDLYSNLLGTKIAAVLIHEHAAATEAVYNESMSSLLPRVLRGLGAVSAADGEQALAAVDGSWWDSTARLPDNELVRKRYVRAGGALRPWLVTPGAVAGCPDPPDPIELTVEAEFDGVPFRRQATVAIELDPEFQQTMGEKQSVLTQDDFPRIVRRIQRDARKKLGRGYDRP